MHGAFNMSYKTHSRTVIVINYKRMLRVNYCLYTNICSMYVVCMCVCMCSYTNRIFKFS